MAVLDLCVRAALSGQRSGVWGDLRSGGLCAVRPVLKGRRHTLSSVMRFLTRNPVATTTICAGRRGQRVGPTQAVLRRSRALETHRADEGHERGDLEANVLARKEGGGLGGRLWDGLVRPGGDVGRVILARWCGVGASDCVGRKRSAQQMSLVVVRVSEGRTSGSKRRAGRCTDGKGGREPGGAGG